MAELSTLAELAWSDRAACRTVDPAVFFPPPGGDERTPLAICHSCPVERLCLDHALASDERFGIWGGMTQRARRALMRGLRRRI